MKRQSEHDVVVPIVHMNGTSRAELLKLRKAAYLALREAEKALMQMSPNGRDYYPEPGLMEKALTQHDRRLKTVAGLMDELVIEADRIECEE